MKYRIIKYEELDSTNNRAKELALFENEGLVVVARNQTQGRGRMGRNWISSKDKSLNMSIVLKPDMNPAEVSKVTLIAASAVNLALLDLGIDTKIKWPNDIILNEKKVSGILTEISCSFEKVNYLVMGIGVNINQELEDLPFELKEIATSIKIEKDKELDIKKLQDRILFRLKELYIPFRESGEIKTAIEISKKKSIILGKSIKIINGDEIREGLALDIDEEGQLLVEFKEGIEKVFYGEVSIRGF